LLPLTRRCAPHGQLNGRQRCRPLLVTNKRRVAANASVDALPVINPHSERLLAEPLSILCDPPVTRRSATNSIVRVQPSTDRDRDRASELKRSVPSEPKYNETEPPRHAVEPPAIVMSPGTNVPDTPFAKCNTKPDDPDTAIPLRTGISTLIRAGKPE